MPAALAPLPCRRSVPRWRAERDEGGSAACASGSNGAKTSRGQDHTGRNDLPHTPECGSGTACGDTSTIHAHVHPLSYDALYRQLCSALRVQRSIASPQHADDSPCATSTPASPLAHAFGSAFAR
eukprot:7233921-Prymnesium_polylepis.1